MAAFKQWLYRNFLPLYIVLVLCGITLVVADQISLRQKALKASALENAAIYTQALESFRTLYTSEVVSKLVPHKIQVRHDYTEFNDAVPLPATLSMALGKHIGENTNGVNVRLYSAFPFPWRIDGGAQDIFERRALSALQQNPEQPFYAFEAKDERLILRYAKADLLRESCVNCHNTHPQSPKTDWQVGEPRGVLSVKLPVVEANYSSIKHIRERIIAFVIFGFLAAAIGFHTINWLKSSKP